jgi:GT2 family glycosyltransferase
VNPRSPNPDKPSVAVILVNWNGWRDTVECINSLLAQQYPSFHIFVVDNDSRDQSVENISAWCATPRAQAKWLDHEGVDRHTNQDAAAPVVCRVTGRPVHILPDPPAGCRVTLIRSGGNLGFAGGCNVGILAAGLNEFDFFWLLNTDTVVHRDALLELIRRASSDERIGIVGSTLRYYSTPQIVQSLGGARMEFATVTSRLIGEGAGLEVIPDDPAGVEREMIYVMGASMLVSSTFIREVGLMQEDYFLYYEEIDWAMRGRSKFKFAYAPASHVFHKSGASSTKVMPLFTANFYYRNRLRFVSRFFPERLAAAKRGLMVDFVRHTLRGRWGYARVVASALWNAPQIVRSAHA